MIKPPDLSQIPDLPDEVTQAGLDGNLILFVGAGISQLLRLPSWAGMAAKALDSLRSQKLLNFFEIEQLYGLDAKKQLSIATMIAHQNEIPLELTSYFQVPDQGLGIYKTINDIGCACVTTNYDELLSPHFFPDNENPGSVTSKSSEVIRISEKDKLLAKYLDEPGSVIHLHGAISKPETMVVTTKDYLEHYDHPMVQHFLKELFEKKTVLFVGYGLEEVEILEHILRRGSVHKRNDRRRFALQGYFRSQESLYKNLHMYYNESFGVHLIGYVRDHQNYAQQEAIFREWAPQIQVKKPNLMADLMLIDEVLNAGS